jgi:hypothetical protein
MVFSSASLKLTGQSFGSGKRIVLVVAALNTGYHGAIYGINWSGSVGAVYYALDNEVSGRERFFADGAGSGGSANAQFTAATDGAMHLRAATILASATTLYQDGVSLSANNNAIASVAAQSGTLYIGESGTSFPNEFINGSVYWWGIGDDITDSDRQKWEGWASWTFAGSGSLLPSGHPYKSAPPYV